ncbi:MAG: PocR ligand-binding domain-containing protein [Geobacteraceae bacterium]|nr:PocR ligand-binding domain-containing protein [Geobacteraceae bacterium]
MARTLAELIDIANLQRLMDHFHTATGIPVGIIGTDGTVFVATGWQEICTAFHRCHPVTAERCRQSDDYINSHPFTEEYIAYKCRNGLWDIAKPIVIADEHCATLYLGQFFYDDEEIDEEYFRCQAQEFGFDSARYMAALRRVPIFTREKVRQIMNYYSSFVDLLVNMGLANERYADTAVRLKKSEEKFFKAFIATPAILAISSCAGGRLIEVNEAFERVCGFGRDEIVGRTPVELGIWNYPAASDRVIETLRNGGVVRSVNIQFRTRTGELREGEYSAEIIDLNGEACLLSLVSDVTERKRAEEALRLAHDELEVRVRERTAELLEVNKVLEVKVAEREAAEKEIHRLNRLYAVLSGTNHAIVRARDRETLFKNICRVAVEQGGFRMAWIGLIDIESGMVKPVTWYGENNGYLDSIRISIREEPEGMGPTGSAIRDSHYHICNDFINDARTAPWHEKGRERGFLSSAAIALTMKNRVIGALTIYAGETNYFCSRMIELLKQMATDISFALDNLDHEERHRKAEIALREETLERLRVVEASREKDLQLIQQNRQAAMGEMIGNIAHQWRQPLNTLGLVIQEMPVMFECGRFSRDYLDERVAKTMAIIMHMSQTIDDFRNFFKPDKEKTTFKVSKEISKTLTLIESGFQEQQIRIEVNTSGDPVIYGHPNEYSQVLLNILLNARDAFAKQKTECPRVIIDLFTEGGKTVVTIADNAGGIPEDVMGRIFDPYFTTKGPDKGTGVGLYMSKIIVEKNMDGRISARNVGNGAEFRIEI